MEMLKLLLEVLQGLSAVLLIVLILLHSPKGDGLGAIGGAAQLFASQKGAEATLNRMTATVAGVFYLLSFVLGHYF